MAGLQSYTDVNLMVEVADQVQFSQFVSMQCPNH